MPGKIKIRIFKARNLPVMDRSSDSSDAFVEVRLGANNHDKTQVCKRSLDPEWNARFVFEVEEDEIQEEPLQIRVLDHDTYSSHDAIGKVYIDLKPLLNKDGPSSISGWFPIYDTLHGIRGEIKVQARVELLNDCNEYRKSSSGVQFFCSSKVPEGYILQKFGGFVEELVVNDDPEYQWIDKIRTPRTSNEARQKLFSQLSGELQRRIGLKVLEMDANCVLGYLQYFDLEGEHGIVVRGIGTAALIVKVNKASSLSANTTQSNFAQLSSSPINASQSQRHASNSINSYEMNSAAQTSPVMSPKEQQQQQQQQQEMVNFDVQSRKSGNSSYNTDNNNQSSANPMPKMNSKLSPNRTVIRTHSDSELTVTAYNQHHTPSHGYNAQISYQQQPLHPQQPQPLPLPLPVESNVPKQQSFLDKLEYPFLTIQQYPIGFIKSISGIVSARSVKLLSSATIVEDENTRDDWLIEIRNEIRSHMKSLNCHVVLGYTETKSIYDDICVLAATGTAAVVDESFFHSVNSFSPTDFNHRNESLLKNCHVCHAAYSENELPFPIALYPCQICGHGLVPDLLFSTVQPMPEIETIGQGCLLRAIVTRPHKKSTGETGAKIVSDYLPFMEYELHRQLVGKLKLKGMNMLYGLRFQISIGENLLIGLAEATACFAAALPAPMSPKIMSEKAEYTISELKEIDELKLKIEAKLKQNREFFNLNHEQFQSNQIISSNMMTMMMNTNGQQQQQTAVNISNINSLDLGNGPMIEPPDPQLTINTIGSNSNNDSKALFKIELDDVGEKDNLLLLLDSAYKYTSGFYTCSTEFMPGISKFSQNLQMFTSVFRCETSLVQMNTKRFNEICDDILQSLFYKFRKLTNCCLCNLSFDNSLYDDDHAMIILTGCCLTYDKNEQQHLLTRQSTNVSNGSSQTDNIKQASQSSSSEITNTINNKANDAVEISTLSYVPNAEIESYLGHINLFLIRESTQIKENGGLSGFMHCFISEMLALSRSHVLSLGGNALISFKMNECVLLDNPHRNQGQCLLNVAGDAVRYKKIY